MRKEMMLAVRVSTSEYEKLTRLACETRRTRGEVLRMLLSQAQLAPAPDVALVPVELRT